MEKSDKLKNFGYGSIVISFSLQRIPFLCPQVSMDMECPRDPRMLQWVTLMARHGSGDGLYVRYALAFLRWLDHQIIMIEDYPYAGTYYIDDPYIPLPTRIQWGDIGKNSHFGCFVLFFFFTYKTNHLK